MRSGGRIVNSSGRSPACRDMGRIHVTLVNGNVPAAAVPGLLRSRVPGGMHLSLAFTGLSACLPWVCTWGGHR